MLILKLLLQFLSLTIWLFIIPFLIGLLPARFMPKNRRTPGVIFLAGYIIFFAIFEFIGILVVLNVVYDGMTTLLRYFTPVAITLAALGLGAEIIVPCDRCHGVSSRVSQVLSPAVALGRLLERKSGQRKADKTVAPEGDNTCGAQGLPSYFLSAPLETKITYLIFFLILAFQLFMALTRASFDGDDAYYIAQSLTAWQRDYLYRFEPYTGYSTTLDLRHALAVFPLWISMLAVKTQIHPTIISHSIIPLFLLPMTYLLFYQIGKSLFHNKKELLPMFMVIISLIQMFGNVSIFTNETFLMTRTWQGKSFAANFVIPAVLWLFLLISDEAKKNSGFIYWILLGFLFWVAALSSSLVVLLALILAACLGFYLAIYYRGLVFLFKTALACVPGAAYIVFYFAMTSGG